MVQADVGKRHAIEDEEGAPVINVAQWHRVRKALGCFGYGETQGAHGFSLSNVQAYALRHLSKRACLNWDCYQCLQTSSMTVLFIVINLTFLAEMVLTCLDVWRCLKMFNFEGFSCHCSMSFHIFPCRSIGLLMFSPPSAGLAPARHSGCQCAQRSHRQSAVHSARAPSDSRRGRWQGPGLSRAGHVAQWWHMFVVSKS